jgi:integrase/recombinase XerC
LLRGGLETRNLKLVNGAGDGIRTRDVLLGRSTPNEIFQKFTVTELSKLSNLSKAYISQVKHGERPPSKKLLNSIDAKLKIGNSTIDYFQLFIESREAMGVTPATLEFYHERLGKFISHIDYLHATRQDINHYLNAISGNVNGFATRYASYKAIKTLYRWLNNEYGISNPVLGMRAPILGKPILPSLDKNQVLLLVEKAHTLRDKAIIALFTDSGLRLTELLNINTKEIDWDNRIIKVLGKGRKEAYAPFGDLSHKYLKAWIEVSDCEENIWGMNKHGIQTMLRRLQDETGIQCNPHTFRRTFACLLRKAGIDTMTIKDLGRWESLEMVQRYTRSVNFKDSLKFYRAPLSQ